MNDVRQPQPALGNRPLDALFGYLQAITALQARVFAMQHAVLVGVAAQMAATLQRDQRIFVFGTGHSHMMAEEAFYRAGGLAAVVPIFSPSLMLHEDAALSSRLEREAGLAEPLLDNYAPEPGEMLFIFSNSGVNHLPVEMALAGRARGLTVVGVSSHAYARVAPLSSLGRRLDEVVDAAIDNGCTPGDAQLPLRDGWAVGAASTVVGATIWNGLVAEAASRLQEAGVQPPVFASLNMDGAAVHNERLLAKWRPRNPHL